MLYNKRVSNAEVSCEILGKDAKSIDVVNPQQLRYLGHKYDQLPTTIT